MLVAEHFDTGAIPVPDESPQVVEVSPAPAL